MLNSTSLNVINQSWETIFHTHIKIKYSSVVCMSMFLFLGREQGKKIFQTKWLEVFPTFSLLLISVWIQFWFVIALENLNYDTFFKDLFLVFMLCFCVVCWWQDVNIYKESKNILLCFVLFCSLLSWFMLTRNGEVLQHKVSIFRSST
jgi:hypothetical protein